MNGMMKENQLNSVKEDQIVKPLIHKIYSILDNCIKDFYNRHYHTFEKKCVYEIHLANNGNDEIVKLVFGDESKNLYELKK